MAMRGSKFISLILISKVSIFPKTYKKDLSTLLLA